VPFPFLVTRLGKERRSTLNGTSAANFVGTVRDTVDAGGVQSLTLAIVNKTGPVELGACGVSSYQV
jgi:hypothetical protein